MSYDPSDFVDEPFPTDNGRAGGWTIVRADKDRTIGFVCLQSRPFGTRTHYWCRRTTLHLRTGCPACAKHNEPRWHGYIQAIRIGDKEKCIVEFPIDAGLQVKAAFEEYKTLRGLRFNLSRTIKKINGKVCLRFDGVTPRSHELPEEVPMWPALFHIFGLTEDTPGEFTEFTPGALTEAERIAGGLQDRMKGSYDDTCPVVGVEPLGDLIDRIKSKTSSNGHH